MDKCNYFQKILIAIIFIFFAISCGKDLPVTNQYSNSNIQSEYLIPQSEALESATLFLKVLKNKPLTKADNNLIVDNVEYLFSNAVYTKGGDDLPVCYLFNFKNNQGFVLISADKRTKDLVFMASEKGSFSLNHTKGTTYEFIVDKIRLFQKQFTAKPLLTKADDGSYTTVETITSTITKGPLIETQWWQFHPFNFFINENTDKKMGCATIAMGQILAYYQKPLAIFVNGTNYVIDWNTIANQTYPIPVSTPDSWKMSVSYFLYGLGSLLGIDYTGNETGVNINQILNAYNSIGANYSYYDGYSTFNISSSINSNKPVQINAWIVNSSTGHSWVIDGYKNLTIQISTYDANGNIVENTPLNNYYNYTSYKKYWHCNMGFWYGLDSGYYQYSQDNLLDGVHMVYIYSSIFNTSEGDYNDRIKIVYDISI